jgi:hypothetical protein
MNTDIMKHREQYKRKHDVQKLFKEFDSNIVSLVFAIMNDDTNKIVACEQKKEEFFNRIYELDEETQDCFFRLLIANYKEYIYGNLCDPAFSGIEFRILSEYDKLISADDYIFNIAYNHEHDPTHYLFNDGQNYFQFYEFVERKGYYIMDMWESDQYPVDEDYEEIEM